MRRTIGTVILTLACTALTLVILWRCVLFDYLEERYPAALYYSQIRAIDDETSEPIDFTIKWDYEAISPFLKGSGPAQIETNSDKTVVVSLVGLPLEDGLNLRIVAPGYSPEVITIEGSQSGFLERAAHVEEVRLRPVNNASRIRSEKEESEQADAPHRSLPPSQKSTSPVRGSED